MAAPADSHQAHFHHCWHGLANPHVRALAWLLDAPNLLDPAAPEWQGVIAALPAVDARMRAWLLALDADPTPLLQWLGTRPHTRIGLYAERLMAFHFQTHGQLVRHGLQVREASGATIGEFDFLLGEDRGGLVHLEFATKFYLLRKSDLPARLDAFVGPNLADSLGRKMRKIVERQLALGRHPAAQALLPAPVVRAQALVKGWLFHPDHNGPPDCVQASQHAAVAELERLTAGGHCRGVWCEIGHLSQTMGEGYVILPRLEWLAPWQGEADKVLPFDALDAALQAAWVVKSTPQLVAIVTQSAARHDQWQETRRVFVVPDGWEARPLIGAA